MDHKVYQLVSQHLLGVEVGDEKANIVTLNFLPSENYEIFCPPHHEPHELVAKQLLDFISLLDSNRNPVKLIFNYNFIKISQPYLTELMLGSIKTLSFSFLDTMTGLRSNSGDS